MCFLFLLLFCDHLAGRTVAKRKKGSLGQYKKKKIDSGLSKA